MEFGLREWKLSDAENIVSLANNEKIAGNLRNTFPYPYTLDDAHLFITKSIHQNKRRHLNKAITIDDAPIGAISLLMQEDVSCKSGELGFWLGEPYWGQGIMTGSIKQICEKAFDELLMSRIWSEFTLGPLLITRRRAEPLKKLVFIWKVFFRKVFIRMVNFRTPVCML